MPLLSNLSFVDDVLSLALQGWEEVWLAELPEIAWDGCVVLLLAPRKDEVDKRSVESLEGDDETVIPLFGNAIFVEDELPPPLLDVVEDDTVPLTAFPTSGLSR